MLPILSRTSKALFINSSKLILQIPSTIRHFYALNNILNERNGFNNHVIISRTIFGFDPTQVIGSRSKEYSENKIFGYSMEQLFDVVANVDDYKYFVPWCRLSTVIEKSESHARANLEIGFPPVVENYTSVLTLARPNLVKSECMDGSLFNYLVCNWRMSQGPKDIPRSCILNFYISFEFKSLLHSQLSGMFFDEVVRQMVNAFEKRCNTVYGVSSLTNTRLDPLQKKKNDLKRRKHRAFHKKLKRVNKGSFLLST